MKKQPFCSFQLAGVSLTEYGLTIPSPFCSLELTNSEITSFTNWTLQIIVSGDDKRKVNIAAFEGLLYSAAQSADEYTDSSGIPVSFMFGWLDDRGSVAEYLSYQGTTLNFEVSASDMFLRYKITGFASIAIKSAMPVLNIPALSGYVKPSAVVEGLALAVKADTYYDLDIDHNDAPTLVNHGAMSTSFTSYVRGDRNGKDDYDTFPGLLTLAKSYNATREAAGLKPNSPNLSTLMNSLSVTELSSYLKRSISDSAPQCASFSFWIDEPTMVKRGTIHFKSKSSVTDVTHDSNTLRYGTSDTNILSLSGSYNGIAYNMTNMNFSSIGFTVDGSGNAIAEVTRVVNSWSSSLSSVFQTANIINDINALASQFSSSFTVVIPGSVAEYSICQSVSLIVMNGNTLSPVSGIYSIVSVTHSISNTFTTTLKLQRLAISSANQTASSIGIYVSGSSDVYGTNSYHTTSNIISTDKVDFGTLYPTFEHIGTSL